MRHDAITGRFLPGPSDDVAARFARRVQITDGCWLVPVDCRAGYGRFNLGDRRVVNAHRVAWELATGAPPPPRMVVGHVCDVRNCVRNDDRGVYVIDGRELPRVGHLWLGTIADNIRDMWVKGRAVVHHEQPVKGERHWSARLDADDVRAIRALRADGWPVKSLAQGFGVHVTTVKDVIDGRSWTHV